MNTSDVVIVGAGAAGLFAAGVAGQRGLRVILIDHAPKVAEKIRISGGGRSNFTNREVGAQHFLSANPSFCRSALSQYTSQDFVALVQSYGIAFHEKHKGQLFCDRSSQDLIDMLLQECGKGQVSHWQPCGVHCVSTMNDDGYRFELTTDRGQIRTRSLVIATGGLSVPKIGATDWGHQLARQFGHTLVPLRPALVPLTFDAKHWAPWVDMAGVSLPVQVKVQVDEHAPFDIGQHKRKGKVADMVFYEDLLFTHRGLSGPAILQISSYWQAGRSLSINLAPGTDVAQALKQAKQGSKKQLTNAWRDVLPIGIPNRLAEKWLQQQLLAFPSNVLSSSPMAETKDNDLAHLGRSIETWSVLPNNTEGYAKAEVTAGGVNTRELNSQTLESKCCEGLFFIGEVVDVTGWLGGYNFQWAWSSAMVCARALEANQETAKIST